MKRGEIYLIKSNGKEVGSEYKGNRPAVIVSNDKNNDKAETVEVVYMTTQPKTDMPTHVFIRSATQPSTLICEQVHTVSKLRVGAMFGKLTKEEMQALDNALAISLGLDFGAAPVMREPTEGKPEKLLEELRATPPQNFIPEDPQNVRLETERDLYKKFSEDLLEILKGGTRE